MAEKEEAAHEERKLHDESMQSKNRELPAGFYFFFQAATNLLPHVESKANPCLPRPKPNGIASPKTFTVG
jgi:hypothetical protein